MGDDARISVRGSGLSRAYGARGISLLLDGVPMNTADGLVDFFEVDPSAYRYVEVFKGGNALRFGANALGGAINLVRSEEHTSELQSLMRTSYAVFCLKKNNTSTQQ